LVPPGQHQTKPTITVQNGSHYAYKNNAISNFCYGHGNSTCNSRQYHFINISSKKIKSPNTSTGGSATTTGTGNSTLGGTDKFSKFSICMRLVSGPLTRAIVDQCYNIVYGTSSTSSVIGSLPNAGPTSSAVPKTSNIGPSSSSSSTTLGTP
jgi:hypothetical protein